MTRTGEGSQARTQRTLAAPGGSDSAQPKNFLQACLLLFLREQPSHGYALIEQLEAIGSRSDRGVVYRTLRVLEREGMVESTWENSDAGPAKRSYSLTAVGEQMLVAWAETIKDCAGMLEEYLRRYARVTGDTPG